MKNIKKIMLVFLLVFLGILFISCTKNEKKYSIKINEELSTTFTVGESDVDFTKFFKIYDENGKEIEVKNEYLDLSKVDFKKAGKFLVTLTYEGKELALYFEVKEANYVNPDPNTDPNTDPGTDPGQGGNSLTIDDLNVAIRMFNDSEECYKYESFDPTLDENDEDYYHEYLAISDLGMVYIVETHTFKLTDIVFKYNNETMWYQKFESENYSDESIETGYTRNEILKEELDVFFKFNDYRESDFKVVDNHFEIIDAYDVYRYDYLYGEELKYTYFNIYINGEYVDYIEFEYEDPIIEDVYHKQVVKYSDFNVGEISEYVAFGIAYYLEHQEQPTSTTSQTVFTDAQLNVGEGEVEYSSSIGANGYTEGRGVQFLQANGDAVLTSKTVVTAKTITITCQTNADSGFDLSVKIGDTDLTCAGNTKVNIEKTKFDELVIVTFATTEEVTGNVIITLDALQSSKSMYILKIEYNAEGGVTPVKDMMEHQVYDPDTFDDKRINDALMEYDGAYGFVTTGEYEALIIPVQFSDVKYTEEELNDLNKVFNATAEELNGIESVRSFYQKSSYGKLDITFNISRVFTLNETYEYYGEKDDGDIEILLAALQDLEDEIDFTKYDYDKDGTLDGVYIIYCGEVDYSGNTNYWAWVNFYVTDGDEVDIKVDGLDIFYFMFAGAEFMYEDTDRENAIEYNGTMKGIELNSLTFIHETGHLLGLDDYYDSNLRKGSNRTLGCSFMMDSNFGDNDPYSKIILDWIDPIIVNETQTVTINPFVTTGDTILIPLNFNNSYFSEYLLVTLYTDEGLNAFYNTTDYYYLFDGEEYGVYIEYVCSAPSDGKILDTTYPTYTLYNNSTTDPSLVWLVEADGETDFHSSDGYAAGSDLWQTGDELLKVFKDFARSDGSYVNFNIIFDDVNANSATITIEFLN